MARLNVVGADPMWKRIEGFPDYEVSSEGQVRTYKSRNGRGLSITPRISNQDKCKGKEYWRVHLVNQEGLKKSRPVHLLVAIAFHGHCPEGMQCRHKDGNAENNAATNLIWGTVQENADDRILHGTQVRGEMVGISKLTKEQVAEIQGHIPIWKRGDGRKFAIRFGVGDSAICAIKKGYTWRD